MARKKKAVSLVLTAATALSILASTALAGDNYEPMYGADYVLTKETQYFNDAMVDYNEYSYDIHGNLIKESYTSYDGNESWTENYCYENQYDSSGNLISVKAYGPGEHSDYELFADTNYQYDDNGNLICETTLDGETIEYYYDEYRLLIREIRSYEDTPYVDISYQYDANGNMIEKIERSTDDDTSVYYVYEYDKNGNITQESIDGHITATYQNEYDQHGNLVKRTSVGELNGVSTFDKNGNENSYESNDSEGKTTIYFEYKKISDLSQELSVSEVFKDIPTNAWYTAHVQYVYDNNLMSGTSSTTFEPNSPLTRAMVVQILYNKEGQPPVSGTEAFSDVKPSDWYYNAVQWAKQNGVAAGSGGKFNPMQNVTREQLAQFLYNYEKTPVVSGFLDYPDANQVSSWAKNAMLWANQNGIVNGKKQSNGTLLLDPKGLATRAEAAAMLKNYLTK